MWGQSCNMNHLMHKLSVVRNITCGYIKLVLYVLLISLKRTKNKEKRNILVISHELSYSGAPMVLMPLVEHLVENGDRVTLLSLDDGPLREELKKKRVQVFVVGRNSSFINNLLNKIVRQFDFALCNTIAVATFVKSFMNSPIDVFWWVHEGQLGFEVFKPILPEELTDNIHLLAVSEYTKNHIKAFCPSWPEATLFTFGVADCSKSSVSLTKKTNMFTIFCAGSVENRKGQDLLCGAIKNIPQNKIRTQLAGRIIDENYFEQYIANDPYVHYHGELTHYDTLTVIRNASLVCVPSKDEPMSAVAIEAMMFSVPVLVSTNCGISSYI